MDDSYRPATLRCKDCGHTRDVLVYKGEAFSCGACGGEMALPKTGSPLSDLGWNGLGTLGGWPR